MSITTMSPAMDHQIQLVHSNALNSSALSSKRCSVASTTKSTLRQSNAILIEMLQSIQTELSTHRSIMLDIQSRVSHLEHESVASTAAGPTQALEALEGGRQSKRTSKLVGPEGQAWWQACQNFARNSDPPISAAEFLRTPRRFSGLEWDGQFGPRSAVPQTPPMTPPKEGEGTATPPTPPTEEDLPPLTPTSVELDLTDLPTPHAKHPVQVYVNDVPPSPSIGRLMSDDISVLESEYDSEDEDEDEDEITEHTIEIEPKRINVPILQPPPPPAKATPTRELPAIEALPRLNINPKRFFRGQKSLATFQAHMKHKTNDKEHVVLIHFHPRSAFKDE